MNNSLPATASKISSKPMAWSGEYYIAHPTHCMVLYLLNYVSVLVARYWFPISLIALFSATLRACHLPAYGGANG